VVHRVYIGMKISTDQAVSGSTEIGKWKGISQRTSGKVRVRGN